MEIDAALGGAGGEADPVADGGPLVGAGGIVEKAGAALGEGFPVSELHSVEIAAQLAHDAGGHEPGGGVRGEGGGPSGVPTVGVEGVGVLNRQGGAGSTEIGGRAMAGIRRG